MALMMMAPTNCSLKANSIPKKEVKLPIYSQVLVRKIATQFAGPEIPLPFYYTHTSNIPNVRCVFGMDVYVEMFYSKFMNVIPQTSSLPFCTNYPLIFHSTHMLTEAAFSDIKDFKNSFSFIIIDLLYVER